MEDIDKWLGKASLKRLFNKYPEEVRELMTQAFEGKEV